MYIPCLLPTMAWYLLPLQSFWIRMRFDDRLNLDAVAEEFWARYFVCFQP